MSNGGLDGKLVSFGNTDKHQEVINSVQGDYGIVPMYLEHNKAIEIGTMIWSGEKDGINVKAVFNDTEDAKRAKASGRKHLSVGYKVRKDDIKGNEHNNIVITEGSLVMNPANDEAVIYRMKSEKQEGANMLTETEIKEKELELKEANIELEKKKAAQVSELVTDFTASVKDIVEAFKSEQKQKAENTEWDVETYTKSATAMVTFAKALVDVDNAKPFKQRFDALSEEVQREKGITNPEALMPAGILARFTNAFERPGGLLRHVDISNLQGLQVGYDSAGSTGSWHAMGDEKTGTLTGVLRSINPEYFYSFIEVPRKLIAMNKANNVNALLDYIMNDLPMNLALGIEKEIVNGTNALQGIVPDTWATKATYPVGDYVAAVKEVVKGIRRQAGAILIMSPDTFANLKYQVGSDGHLIYPATSTLEDVARGVGVNEIVLIDGLDEDLIVSMTEKGYLVAMNSGLENFNDFDIKYNSELFLSEVLIGGALKGKRFAKSVTPAASEG